MSLRLRIFFFFWKSEEVFAYHIENFAGSDGFEEIFSPRKVKNDTSTEVPSGSMNRSPSFLAPVDDKESCSCLDPTLASLEAELLESQSNCAELRSSESSSNPHLQHLAQKLETMHRLLARLRDQVYLFFLTPN